MRRESNFKMLQYKDRYTYQGIVQEVSFEQMFKAFKKNVVRTKETTEEYKKADKVFRDKCKDRGAFIMGEAKENKREKSSILSRNMITLDLDYCPSDILDILREKSDFQDTNFRYFVYSTHSHAPESPRLRLVIPLVKDVSPEEYEPIAHRLCGKFGLEYFDATTCQANRIMYFPSVSLDGEYICEIIGEEYEDCNGQEILEEYFDWKNIDEWQRPHYIEGKKREKLEASKDKDSTKTKYRMVNNFNTAYSIKDAVDYHLKDIYKEEFENRYTYIDGESRCGLHLFNLQWGYSFHGSDPAQGRLLNAFDIVRIHKFGHLDKDTENKVYDDYNGSNSFQAMCEWIRSNLPNVMAYDPVIVDQKKEVVERLEENGLTVVEEDATEWMTKLVVDKHGAIKKLPYNISLIVENEPALKGLFFYDTIKQQVCYEKPPYWDSDIKKGEGIRDLDFSFIRQHISKPPYYLSGKDTIEDAVLIESYKKKVNYPKQFLSELPDWDGVPRCEEIFMKLFGVQDCDFVREASKKWLTALIARIMKPGVKFDYTIALLGSVGIGKSTWGKSLIAINWDGDMRNIEDSNHFFSDKEIDLKNNRDTIDAIRGICILELSEFDKFFNKYDKATLKSFMTINKDRFIERYGKRTIDVPRSFVMLATSNEMKPIKNPDDERRFLPFYCHLPKNQARIFDKEYWNKDIRDQLLAEALHYFQSGYSFSAPFDKRLEKQWDTLLEKASLENDYFGVVKDYVENRFPESYLKMDLETMRTTWKDKDGNAPHRSIRNEFSVREIYCVALDKRKGDRTDYNIGKDIESSLRRLGFEKVDVGRISIGELGQQHYYKRVEDPTLKISYWENKTYEEQEEKHRELEEKDFLTQAEEELNEYLTKQIVPF